MSTSVHQCVGSSDRKSDSNESGEHLCLISYAEQIVKSWQMNKLISRRQQTTSTKPFCRILKIHVYSRVSRQAQGHLRYATNGTSDLGFHSFPQQAAIQLNRRHRRFYSSVVDAVVVVVHFVFQSHTQRSFLPNQTSQASIPFRSCLFG